jgi:hypothetical protein
MVNNLKLYLFTLLIKKCLYEKLKIVFWNGAYD